MRIERNNRTNATSSRGAAGAGKSGGAVFQPMMGDAGKTAGAAPLSAASGIDAILALQGIDDPLFSKRKTVKRGQSILDTLEEVKADLLVGRVGEGRLNKLLALVQQARDRVDPDLDALVDDIELRALVELAKLGLYRA